MLLNQHRWRFAMSRARARPLVASASEAKRRARPVLAVFAEVVVPVAAVAAVSGLVGRRLHLDVDTLSRAVFFLFSPCLVFTSLAGLRLGAGAAGRVAAVAASVFVVNLLVAAVWSRVRGHDAETAASLSLASSAPNQGNLGLPIARLAFGPAGLDVAVLLWVVGTTLWSSLGVMAASLGRVRRVDALLAPLRYPAVYGAAAGLAFNAADVELPRAIGEPIATLAAASIPSMLVVLGLQFRPLARRGLGVPVAAAVNRLLVGPLVAWPLVSLLDVPGVAGRTTIVIAGMPTAVIVVILAAQLDARPDLAVRSVVLTTMLSLVTLTVLLDAFR